MKIIQPGEIPATVGNGNNGPDATTGAPNGAPKTMVTYAQVKFPEALGDSRGKPDLK